MSPAPRTGAGYSGTPLAKKLGIGAGHRVWLVDAPANYRTLVAPLPDGVSFVSRPSGTTDVAHVFASTRRDLEKTLRGARKTLKPDAAIWVSWPKKSSAKRQRAHRHHRRRHSRRRPADGIRRHQGVRRGRHVVRAEAGREEGASRIRTNPINHEAHEDSRRQTKLAFVFSCPSWSSWLNLFVL